MKMTMHCLGWLLTTFLTACPLGSETRRPISPGGVPPLHLQNRFQFVVSAPYLETAALFGASGERRWALGAWDPRFLYPQPEADIEGAVFTVEHGLHTSVWVNTVFDLRAKHFQYVSFVPDVLVTTIDVNFQSIDAGNTQVSVAYTRTALGAASNDQVRMLGEKDRELGKHWQEAIDGYLESRKP